MASGSTGPSVVRCAPLWRHSTGAGGEAGGQVVQLHADRLRLDGDEFGLVVQEKEPGAGVEVGGDRGGRQPGGQDFEGSSPRLTRFIAFTQSSTSA